MSVREQKMAETRKKLIEVARRTFAEYGYADTSMDKLTAEAGLTRFGNGFICPAASGAA